MFYNSAKRRILYYVFTEEKAFVITAKDDNNCQIPVNEVTDRKRVRLFNVFCFPIGVEWKETSELKGPPQKSIFVQESPNELKFIGYVGGIM